MTQITRPHYSVIDGCHNCRHMFKKIVYSDGPEMYCNYDNNRPQCNSMAMDGEHDAFDAYQESLVPGQLKDVSLWNAYGKALNTWIEWADAYSIHPSGRCDYYIRDDRK